MAKASPKQSTKVKPDWEAINREYRAGVLSVREIARAAGIDHALIIRRAKKFPEQWQRDLTKRVRAAVVRKVAATVVTTDSVTTAGDEESIIEAASNRGLQLHLLHQGTAAKLSMIEAALSEELQGLQAKKRKVKGEDKPVALSTKVTIYLALVTATEKRIRIERQAYGLSEDSRPGGDGDVNINITFVRPGDLI